MNAKAQTVKAKKTLNFEKYSGSAEKLNALAISKAPPDGTAELKLIDRHVQVRKKFNPVTLQELADDIKEQGLLQAVLLRKKPNGRYDLIAGERRYRAAELAGLEKIPYRLVPADIDDLAIRKMQVSENEKREGLTPFERAMGVAEDVEKYGADEACRIWGKKAPWVSKRLTALRLPSPILALFRDEVISDLEMLNSLNNIFLLDEKEFSAIVAEIEEDVTYSRDQLRDKEALIKERIQRKSDQQLGGAKTSRPAAKSMASAAGASGEKTPIEKKNAASPTLANTGAAEDNYVNTKAGDGSTSTRNDVETDAVATDNATPPAIGKGNGASRESLERKLKIFREEMYNWGLQNGKQFLQIQNILDSLGNDDEESVQLENWVKWAGFQSIVLPLVAALGEKTSEVFLRRLAGDLKKNEAKTIWDALHPAIEPGGVDAKRDEAPALPPGWRL